MSTQCIQSVGVGNRNTLAWETKALDKSDKYILTIAEYHPFIGF